MKHSAFFLSLAVVLLHSCAGNNESGNDKSIGAPEVMVSGIVLHPRSLDNKIVATGTLLANEEVEIRGEVPGRVTTINFDEGSFVTKGRLLIKIEDDELQAQYKKLRFEEKQASDDLFRKEKLLELKAVSQEEYDRAEILLGIIRSQIDLLKSQISKTEVYAPFDGRIGLRRVSQGEFISSSEIIASLIQTDPIKIDFTIPEKYLRIVRTGAKITFHTESSDSTFTGSVYAIEPKIDPSTRNITLRAICPNPGNILVPGSFARVDIILEQIPDALILPTEAVIPHLNGEKVLVYRSGKVQSRIIRTGIRTEREVQVIKGLEPGDTVLTTGLLQVRDGMTVKIKLS